MLKKMLIIIFIISIILPNKKASTISNNNINIKNSDIIGEIIIPKINIDKPLFRVQSPENNIEKNITILKESIFPDKDNSIMLLAAHSGTGEIAYFNDLDKLTIEDEIILIINKTKYIYKVNNIWEEKKNGYININKENKKQLVLTTCSPNKEGYQLVINCIEKESI